MKSTPTWSRTSAQLLVTLAAVGLGLDVWSHDATERAETFFSPWHLPLYGSVTALAYLVLRDRMREGSRLRWHELGDLGLGLMILGGVGDAVWHEVAGIEETVEGFFSLPHLIVFAALICLALGPAQVAISEGLTRPPLALVASTTAAALVASIATTWATPFARQPGMAGQDATAVAAAMGGWIVQALILGLLIGLVLRLWPDRPSLAAVAVGSWWLSTALVSSRPRQALLALPIAVAVLVAHRIGTASATGARAARVAGAAGGVAAGSWFAAAELFGTSAWTVHLTSGAVALSLLTAAGVARLLHAALPRASTAPPVTVRDHAVL